MKPAHIILAIISVALPAIAHAQVPNIPLQRFRPCLEIENMTKDRLDCYDEIVPPEPKAAPPRARVIVECRFLKEEDARVMCFNSFLAERPAVGGAAPRPVVVPTVMQRPPSTTTGHYVNIPLERFRTCLAIEDNTKRLACYDAIVKPEPTVVIARAKVIGECRFLKEEERLMCFNRFLVVPTVTHRLPAATRTVTTTTYVKRGRGGCGSRGGAGYRTKSGRCASRKR